MGRMPRAEQLDRPLVFFRQVEVGRNAINEPILEWREQFRCFGRQIILRGSEPFATGQVQGTARLIMRIRWCEGVSVMDRVRFDGLMYEVVVPPIEVGRKNWLDVELSARSDGGTIGWH
jgi:SPP1 family predicted phage head-tail adaptor